MQQYTIEQAYAQTISWHNNKLVDWALGGRIYSPDENNDTGSTGLHYAYGFDAAITSADGQYAFIYKKLGTKGMLLKNGQLLREINRSYYHADTYEYPAAFITTETGVTYLAHCPQSYCRLELEEVETGYIPTDIPERNPADFFHSRLEVSPGNSWFVSKGWVWHPMDDVRVFNINDCLRNPLLLDKNRETPDFNIEINTACFISDNELLIGASYTAELYDEEEAAGLKPGQVAIWNLVSHEVSSPVKIDRPFGNLFPIDENEVWDLFLCPKIINIHTGEVTGLLENMPTSEQASAIIHHLEPLQVAGNPALKSIAIITRDHQIKILTR